MSEYPIYSMTPADAAKHANTAFGVALRGLVAFGELSAEQGQRILENYSIIMAEKGWFGRAIDKLFERMSTKHNVVYELVKVPPSPPTAHAAPEQE